MPREIPYVVSKAAIQGVTATLAAALAASGATVNCVNPGPNDTGWPDDATRGLRPGRGCRSRGHGARPPTRGRASRVPRVPPPPSGSRGRRSTRTADGASGASAAAHWRTHTSVVYQRRPAWSGPRARCRPPRRAEERGGRTRLRPRLPVRVEQAQRVSALQPGGSTSSTCPAGRRPRSRRGPRCACPAAPPPPHRWPCRRRSSRPSGHGERSAVPILRQQRDHDEHDSEHAEDDRETPRRRLRSRALEQGHGGRRYRAHPRLRASARPYDP